MKVQEILEKARINFKPGVPDILFKKVGGQCSVPRCNRPTSGPFIELGDAANMGVACHIFSAAKDGPRGRGGMDEEFIKSERNGIWCCQYHASLIDKKKGIDYPAPTLFAWKKLAEARVLKKMNDMPSPLGWVESIELSRFPTPFGSNPKVVLSRYTLLTGRNGSGKTALLEAAAAICNSKYLDRLAGSFTRVDGKKVGVRIDSKTIYTTVDRFSKELYVVADDFVIRRKEGNTPCLLPPGDIEVIFCSEKDAGKRSNEDDVGFLTRALNVDVSAFRELLDIGLSNFIDGTLSLRDAMEEDDLGDLRLRRNEYGEPMKELVLTRTSRGETYDVTYDALSTSEQGLLLIALSITKAREVAKQKLTLLAIDGLAINFDAGNFEKLLRALREEDFQVVVTLPPIRQDSITEVVDGDRKLRDLEYLNDWTLQQIGVERSAWAD